MPLFVFACDACRHESELLVRADAKPQCPRCGAKKMTKQASRFAAVAAQRAEPMGCGKPSCCMMQGGCQN